MRLMSDRLAILVSFGLTETQARTYLVLLQYPVMNIGALSKAAQLPRNRTYETVEQLQELGLAEILVDGTRKVRARPITDFLDTSVRDLEGRIGHLQSRRDVLAVAFQPPRGADAASLETSVVQAIVGRRAVARELDRLMVEAKETLTLSASTGGCIRLMRHLQEAPSEVRARFGSSLHVEIFLPRAGLARGGLEPLLDHFEGEVHIVDTPLASILAVADGREALVVHPIPDDDRLTAGGDRAILSKDFIFAEDHVRLLRLAAGFQPPELELLL